MKYYFETPDSELCYNKDYFIELMKERDINEMEVFPAHIITGESFFWCSEYQETGETGESCGRQCEKYKPRNGKNGRCRYHSSTYEPIDKPIILRLKK